MTDARFTVLVVNYVDEGVTAISRFALNVVSVRPCSECCSAYVRRKLLHAFCARINVYIALCNVYLSGAL